MKMQRKFSFCATPIPNPFLRRLPKGPARGTMSTMPSSVSSFASLQDSFDDAFHFPISLHFQKQKQEQPPQLCVAAPPPAMPASQMHVNVPVVPFFGLALLPDVCSPPQDQQLHIDQSNGCKSSLKQEVSQNLNIVRGKSCTSKEKKIIMDSNSMDNVVIERGTAEGLPPGWIKEIKIQKKANGTRKDPYYTDPKSGYIFRSKMDALRFLETGDVNSCIIKPTKMAVNDLASIKYEILHDTHQSIGCNSPLKPDVTQNLKTITDGSCTYKEKKVNGSCTSKDKKVVIERATPEGLPPGWIKEIRIQKKANRIRKDPYYTDPVSGYVFRSKMDALRFLETGDVNSCAIKPTKKGITDLELTDDRILSQSASNGPDCATRGRLFGDLETCDTSRLVASDAEPSNKKCKNLTAGATVASILVAKYLEEHWHINLIKNYAETKESSDWNKSATTGFRNL